MANLSTRKPNRSDPSALAASPRRSGLAASVRQFGARLLQARDLDPIYDMLRAARLDGALNLRDLRRWCVAYWLFYHAGAASRIVEGNPTGEQFWKRVLFGFDNYYPRGAERRHFRGDRPRAAVESLRDRFPEPGDLIDFIAPPGEPRPLAFNDVSRRAQELPMFGAWLAFKVADMLDRVLEVPVAFDDAVLAIYSEPVAGAEIVALERNRPEWTLHEVVAALREDFKGFLAPPSFDRPLNVQEVETILCKYKSHLKGHYPIGNDRREIKHGLREWGNLANDLRRCLAASDPEPRDASVASASAAQTRL